MESQTNYELGPNERRSELKSVEREIEQFNGRVLELENAIAGLAGQKRELESSNSSLVNQNRELDKVLRDKRTKQSELADQNQELERQLEEKEKRQSELEAKLKSVEGETEQFNNRVRELENATSNLVSQIHALQQANSWLTNRNQELREQVQDKLRQRSELDANPGSAQDAEGTLPDQAFGMKETSERAASQAPEIELEKRMPEELESKPLTPEEVTNPSAGRLASIQDRDYVTTLDQTKTLTRPLMNLDKTNAEALGRVRKHALRQRLVVVVALGLLSIGSIALIESLTYSSIILTFAGLGLIFWGGLLLYVRPTSYARVELVDSTALSSIQAVDRIIYEMGYNGRGIYLPKKGSEWAVLFVPADKNSTSAPADLDGDSVIQSDPRGIAFVPPGMDLAKFFLERLKKGKDGVTVETLKRELPRLFVAGLEIMDEFDMQVNDDLIVTKSTNSLYKDFCNEIKLKTRVCTAFGCPICSAVACLLVYATGQPVRLEGDEIIPVGNVSETKYRILQSPQQNTQPMLDLVDPRAATVIKTVT